MVSGQWRALCTKISKINLPALLLIDESPCSGSGVQVLGTLVFHS